MKEIIDRVCDIECVTEDDAKAVAALADLAVQLQSRLEELNQKVTALQQENASLKQDASDARKKAIEDCSELLSRQHTWITNIAAATLVMNIDTAMQANSQ